MDEDRIKAELRKEDLRIQYEDEVLANERRKNIIKVSWYFHIVVKVI